MQNHRNANWIKGAWNEKEIEGNDSVSRLLYTYGDRQMGSVHNDSSRTLDYSLSHLGLQSAVFLLPSLFCGIPEKYVSDL